MSLAPPDAVYGRRLNRAHLALAGGVMLLAWAWQTPPGQAAGRVPMGAAASYDNALRMREALEGLPQQQRTRRDYDRVLAAFRAVYHAAPGDPHADASADAVAGLLAAEGHLFEDRKAFEDAIGQYEFLRREYPGSRYRFSALLTEGELYSHDLGDLADARTKFSLFLRLYPENPLAGEARQELTRLRGDDRRALPLAAGGGRGRTVAAGPAGPAGGHHNAVLDAAIASRDEGSAHSQAKSAANRSYEGTRQGQTAGSSAGSSAGSGRPGTTQGAGSQARLSSGGASAPVQGARSGSGGSAGVTSGRGLANASDAGAVGDVPGEGQEPAPHTALSEAALNATPPPRRGRLPLVTGVRQWSTAVYTRVAIDLESEVRYEASRAPNPDRIFFDLHGARLSPELIGKAVTVTDGGFLKRIRVAQSSEDMVRIVLDVSNVSEYSAFFLPNPSRLIIDIHGQAPGSRRGAAPVESASAPRSSPAAQAGSQPAGSSRPAAGRDALGDIATLDRQPNTVRATRTPTTAPVSASVPDTTPASQAGSLPGSVLSPAPDMTARGARSAKGAPTSTSAARARGMTPADASAPAIHAAEPTAAGERSMVRTLGLKIGRIVVDAGHGGHDSGTLGPGGIEEKDVVLDVALRLGKLLKQRLGADVIYTRDDDTFIPLETRTAIANKAQADLFISVHANSSQDANARGVETYYLNFTTSADALEVAARENAVSQQSIHQLSDLVKKITLQDKISESREFAGDVEQSLYTGLEAGNPGLKDRGVKKAPFVVLIGANMPSILAEISFLTNPDDARQLRDGEYRQRIAESLYRGVAKYIGSLSGVRLAESGGRPAGE